MDLASTIRSVPDFSIEGILFYDITTLLKNPAALRESIDQVVDRVAEFKRRSGQLLIVDDSRNSEGGSNDARSI